MFCAELPPLILFNLFLKSLNSCPPNRRALPIKTKVLWTQGEEFQCCLNYSLSVHRFLSILSDKSIGISDL